MNKPKVYIFICSTMKLVSQYVYFTKWMLKDKHGGR